MLSRPHVNDLVLPVLSSSMLIESLEKEQEELMTCMRKMETTQNKNQDEFNSAQLTELARFEKHYQQLILEEVQSTNQLDVKVIVSYNVITMKRPLTKKLTGCPPPHHDGVGQSMRPRIPPTWWSSALPSDVI